MVRLQILCLFLLLAVVGTASADRLILIPTGRTLGTGDIRAEYISRTDSDDGQVYRLATGVSRFEVEGARFQNFGSDSVDLVSGQVSLLPETSFTPGVAVGVRDIADNGAGTLYGGRSFYVAATKGIPVTGGIPFLLQDVKFHGGVGTDSLSGVFFGAEGKLPLGIKLAVEYDTEDFNYAVAYSVVPTVTARAEWIRDDFYYGADFSVGF
ncbi:MAG: hypothetical protein ACYC2Y_01935 [Armatimonadota bacterium]